jgi:hypothetical protein
MFMSVSRTNLCARFDIHHRSNISFLSCRMQTTRNPPHALAQLEFFFTKELDLDFISIYIYLFEKVSNLESILIITMCFIISMRNMVISYQWI